jgi:mannose/fructose/N-acetylgalactosamine-specific phosphotransferase system component IIB
VTGAGTGFRGYVASEGMGLYNSATQKGLSNPSNGGTFYNTDGLYHTYRYAVTPDRRVFVYRDGIAVDTVRTSDLALPEDFCTENGDVVANLIKNPGFEGEWNRRPADNLTYRIEGWDVSPLDQYNSTQSIVGEERSNDVDQDNHVLEVNRYKWSAGWGAAEISQTVDVAPNEVYSFSALAKGGIKSDGTQLASLRIQDLQDSNNKATIPITGDSYQKYAADFTTSATCKQIRIVCYLERDKWGASISDFRIDDVKLTGVSRRAKAQIGFTKNFADLAYFTYDATGAYAPLESSLTASADTLLIDGTGKSGTFTVSGENLTGPISVTATAGFTASPSKLDAGSQDVTVTVTSTTTLARNTGKVILRSGDKRTYVKVTSLGTPLERRDLSQNPVYTGTDDSKSFEGFSPTDKGYTLEFRARTDDATKFVYPYAVTGAGTGFRGYVASEGMGLYNSATQKGLSNPSNGGTFYNTDGLYHTYRYAVTPDRRVFVYRDGIAVDTVRTSDLALPEDFCTENGDVVANLIKNPGFEGEWNRRPADNLTYRIEGWDVSPLDQYNSTQSVVGEERSNDVDQDNHVLEVNRYKWSAGWGAAEISQTVDVAPNEVYSFSALAKGGIKSDGTQLASLRIQDLQDSNNKATIPITGDSYQKYAADFTTSATCKQIRIVCYLERDKWGASISDFRIDDVKLTGVSRRAKAQIGFTKNFADLAYFTYDTTGAYAPLESSLTASADTLLIDGTGKSGTFTVSGENLTGPISVTATAGFTASPSKLDAGSQDVTVTVTSTTTLARNTGKVILRSGDKRTYVRVTSLGTPLERRDLSQNPVYTGTDDSKSFEGFSPTDKGYTLEFRARTDDATKFVYPYAVTGAGTGFRGYVASEGMGLYNSATQKGLSNPSNGGTFYNTDGLYHTYRYAVTPDRRVFVYRDGIAVDTVRTSDLALPEDFCTENGDVVANLIKNPGFEGEWNRRPADNLTYRIEGWDVSPLDQYNSTQSVVGEERSNDVDQDNHVLEVNRYKWSAGWGAAEISQTVDVAPNEVYSFSALAKGGIKSDGTQLASLRIQDLQDSNNKATIPITGDSYQKYAADFTTSATCKQIRIVCYLERDKWGASISDFRIDDVKLTGVSRRAKAQIGFTKNFADLAYFTYDTTGAYAPLESSLTASADTLLIDGTGKSGTFTVSGENLTGPISVTATAGFTASPSKLDAGSQDVTVTVTSTTTLARNTGKVILRSGDKRTYVRVTSLGTPLERRDLSQNPVYTGTDDSKSFEGFSPTDKGYTLEFRARTDDATKFVYPYAVTGAGTGFRGYVASEGMGLYNSATQKGLSNPSNGGTFYNTDGLYHTYRYAVTPDRRVFVYRDGIAVDTVRTSDLALPEDFCTENGDVVANLIKNPGFEGEWNRRPSTT